MAEEFLWQFEEFCCATSSQEMHMGMVDECVGEQQFAAGPDRLFFVSQPPAWLEQQ